MAIVDLKPKQGKVDIVVDIVAKETPREFNKFGKSGKVCNATVKDETGEMKLSLWNDDVDKVEVGDKVQITNGYVNEYQGELQLTSGRFGKLEVVGKSDSVASNPESNSKSEPKQKLKEPVPEDAGDDLSVDEEDLEEF